MLLRRIFTAGFVSLVTLSATGDKMAYAGADPDAPDRGAILVVDLAAGGPPRKVTHTSYLALSPDGETLAVGTNTVDLYDARSLVKIRSLDLHPPTPRASCVAFDRSGSRLAAAMLGEVVVIDVASWTVVQRVPRGTALLDTVLRIDFTEDLVLVRAASGAVERVSVAPGAAGPLVTFPGNARDAAAGGGKAWTLSQPASRFGVQRLAAFDAKGAVLVEEELPGDAIGIRASADGFTLAIIHEYEGIRSVSLRDGRTLRPLRSFDLYTSAITALGVRPGSGELHAGNRDGTHTRWDLRRGTLVGTTTASDRYRPSSISFDEKGEQMVAGDHGYFVRVHDAADGQLLRQWKPHGDRDLVLSTFLPASSELVTASMDGAIKRWDLSRPAAAVTKTVSRFEVLDPPAGREIGALGHTIKEAALSSDGHWLAFDGEAGVLGVIDTTTGALRWEAASPSGSERSARWIAFSADGSRLLLSTSLGPGVVQNGVLRVFDASTGAVLQTLHPMTVGPMAARGSVFALGGVRPVLLEPRTFAIGAPIDVFDSEITAVTVHPSRDLLILGSNGGATEIASASNGKAIALFLDAKGGDFVATTPEGAFVSSADGARSLAWVFNAPLEGHTFEQYAALYEQPDAVRRRLAGEPPSIEAPMIRPPRLLLEDPLPNRVSTSCVTLRATVNSRSRVDRVRVFVNGRASVERNVCASSASIELEIPLIEGTNRLSLVAYDATGFAGTPRLVDVVSASASARRPELYVVSLGVSRYPRLGPEHQLAFATADARSIAEAFASQTGPNKPYSRVHPVTLLDEEVTVESVEKALAGLSAMSPDDMAVVFFAGHGVQLEGEPGAEKRMLLLTARAALSSASARDNGVGWDRIERALGGARGRVLMLLDACHAGHVSTEIIAPNEALARQLTSGGRAGVLVFAASRGSQLSYEVPSAGTTESSSRGLTLAWDGKAPPISAKPGGGGHGLFTGSLLEALTGGAPDRDHSGAVEVGELFDFVTERVRAASNGKQTPWVARREMFGDFVLAPAGGD